MENLHFHFGQCFVMGGTGRSCRMWAWGQVTAAFLVSALFLIGGEGDVGAK